MIRSRFALAISAALYFTVLASLAFVIAPGGDGRFMLWTVLAFVPIGAFLLTMFGRNRWWAALAFSVVAAAWLEAAQTVWMPAGYANIVDILLATLGAAIGIAGAATVSLMRERSAQAHGSRSADSPSKLKGARRASSSNSAQPLNLDR